MTKTRRKFFAVWYSPSNATTKILTQSYKHFDTHNANGAVQSVLFVIWVRTLKIHWRTFGEILLRMLPMLYLPTRSSRFMLWSLSSSKYSLTSKFFFCLNLIPAYYYGAILLHTSFILLIYRSFVRFSPRTCTILVKGLLQWFPSHTILRHLHPATRLMSAVHLIGSLSTLLLPVGSPLQHLGSSTSPFIVTYLFRWMTLLLRKSVWPRVPFEEFYGFVNYITIEKWCKTLCFDIHYNVGMRGKEPIHEILMNNN